MAPPLDAITHVDQLPGRWPDPSLLASCHAEEALSIVQSIVPQVTAILAHPATSRDVLPQLFHPDGFFRDLSALTWSFRSFQTVETISAELPAVLERAAIPEESIRLQEERVIAFELPTGASVIRVPFTFRTTNPPADCTAAFKLVRLANGDIKVFTVTTALDQLDAAPWRRPLLGPNGQVDDAKDSSNDTKDKLPAQTDVLVIGGGHAGLSLSASLKALNIDHVVVDKEAAIGDAWAKRYDSATLHTTRLFSGLPYLPFPKTYPEYVGAKLVAQYYKDYVRALDLPAYPGRECVEAYKLESGAWRVNFANGETTVARELIFAVGIGGRVPVLPDIPGMDTFAGTALHSAQYHEPIAWKGKRVVVVGSSTTACDIAHECSRIASETTIVQRGATRVYPQAHISTMQATFWNEVLPIEVGDVMASEDPIALQSTLCADALAKLTAALGPDYYAGIEKAGFLATTTGSFHQQIFQAAGRHYPDIGCMEAIVRGDVRIRSGAAIERITPEGIVFAEARQSDGSQPDGRQINESQPDGRKLDVDVIVYATGFEKDARQTAWRILRGGKDAHPLEPVWGLNSEGEVRGTWTRNGDVWFHGGELQTMRFYGQYLAMQMAAELSGIRPEPIRA